MYEAFEHTSDLGLRVKAPALDALFREAAEGLFALIAEDWEGEGATERHEFHLEADAYDMLLFDWLGELLYTFHTAHILLSGFEVKIGERSLDAAALGTPLDQSVHRLLHEVKAITYHGLKVERSEEGWLAEVIVDI
jgi:SHS2 domain-containing protein